MVIFKFTVNASFLNESNHPITVPKSHVDYKEVRAQKLEEGGLTIIYPMGERNDAHLYSGEAGYGHYYQIRTHGENRTIPSYLTKGMQLLVALFKFEGKSYVIIEEIK